MPTLKVEGFSPSPLERWLPSIGLAAALLICLASPTLATSLAPVPFLIAALVLGLPHGAADGVVLLRDLSWPGRILRIAVYLALMTLAAAVLMLFPSAALLGFLILSWWHFGAADGETLAGHEKPRWLCLAWSFGRGGLVVAVPFAADPLAAWAPFARLAELLGVAATFGASQLSVAGLIATGAAISALALCTRISKSSRPGFFEWVETALILLLGLAADPLFAVGCYFLLVHGFRQSVALGKKLISDQAPSLRRRLTALHMAALPLLIPSWLALMALALWAQPASARDLAILSLTLYVVATPPHHLFHEVLR